ncbi:MAG TPA: tetratricopeptide repeat protein [Rhizomicrobium sp.]|jgi:Flp pilus assembly protein TadD
MNHLQEPAPEALLHQAIRHHQAGRLPEAEALYRRVLAACPDSADVHVNLGVLLMMRGDLAAAALSCRQGLALQPDHARGCCYLGDILAAQGRLDEAISSYGRALAAKPDYAEGHNSLGNALFRQGRSAEAMDAYRDAIAHKPDFAEPYNNLGYMLLQQGRLQEAESHLRRALSIRPQYAQAHSNLGAVLGQQGRLAEAQNSCRQALALQPNQAESYNNVGLILQKQGHLREAEASFRKAIALRPSFLEAGQHLGVVLCESGRISEGFEIFNDLARRRYGTAGADPNAAFSPHKLRHDEEQRAWLGQETHVFHLGDGGRMAGPAVNPHNRVAEISALWKSAKPQIVVIDDLLTPDALVKLRRFCLESTVWRQVYDGGYLGAFPEHGFAPPLLAQIAEELRATYPAIIEDHPLLHFWAFKYDSALAGIRKHADFAAVNVNFWITPDEANLNPERGGLVVWDKAAPLDWDFARYNAAREDIAAFLKEKDARPVSIPYRANRAVIFDSDLFHETDTIHFKPGYENRRINVTLLFGRRQSQGGKRD